MEGPQDLEVRGPAGMDSKSIWKICLVQEPARLVPVEAVDLPICSSILVDLADAVDVTSAVPPAGVAQIYNTN